MIRHETRPTQTATQPLRTARDVAPICCQAPATDEQSHICTPKFGLVSTFIAQHDLGDAPPPVAQCPTKDGQILKYP